MSPEKRAEIQAKAIAGININRALKGKPPAGTAGE